MENRRFFLICALGVVVFFIWQAWQEDYASEPARPAVEEAGAADATQTDVPQVPRELAQAGKAAPEAPDEGEALTGEARVTVETDVYHAQISLNGGDLRRLELKGYAADKSTPEVPVALFDDRGSRLFVVQSGLLGSEQALSSQYTRFSSARSELRLAPGQDTIEVSLQAQPAAAVRVIKTYRFHRGSYEIGLIQRVVNDGDEPLQLSPFVQLWRTPFKLGQEPPFVHTFSGYGIYEQKPGTEDYRFEKHDLDDVHEKPFKLEQRGGWLAMVQHYFVAAILPPADEPLRLIGRPSKTRGYLGQYIGAPALVAAGAEQQFVTRLYAGPTLQHGVTSPETGKEASEGFFDLEGLENIAPGLDLTVDYGLLTPIAVPLFWVLQKFHGLTGNWGVAIILLTMLVKLAMYKLSEAQYRSMAKMRQFAPRIQELRERYGDDRQRQQKAMMELYQKEGFNPLGGCWPMLVQFPVFISLYWVLLQSVELRQADFMLWINDLSAKDPYFVLPVLFAVSMWLQQKLSGSTMTMDPMQQRIMNAMPIAMGAFFTMFPAGLVLYWFVSNLISIAQQWLINRKLDREGLGRK